MSKEIRPENDVNRLSNQQVVLLTMLVAIVSSVASALVVVQFFAQNPSQTVVNTVREVVTQAVVGPTATSTNTVVEKTYVIKEGDLVAKAVELNQNARIGLVSGLGDAQQSLGWGLVLSENQIISLEKTITENVTTEGGVSMRLVGRSQGFALWETVDGVISRPAITNKQRASLNLGETIVMYAVTGSVRRGIVSEVGERSIIFSETLPENSLAMLIDLSGNVIGFSNGQMVTLTNVLLESLEGNIISESEKQNLCESANGLYLPEYGECEGVSAETCSVLGGSFDVCASACRHDAEADTCIDVCVPLCVL